MGVILRWHGNRHPLSPFVLCHLIKGYSFTLLKIHTFFYFCYKFIFIQKISAFPIFKSRAAWKSDKSTVVFTVKKKNTPPKVQSTALPLSVALYLESLYFSKLQFQHL